jgi:hypothetical protein
MKAYHDYNRGQLKLVGKAWEIRQYIKQMQIREPNVTLLQFLQVRSDAIHRPSAPRPALTIVK